MSWVHSGGADCSGVCSMSRRRPDRPPGSQASSDAGSDGRLASGRREVGLLGKFSTFHEVV